MEIIIKNITGSQVLKAFLYVESGVIVFETGEVSHIISEKSFNKEITVYKEVVKQSASTVQSEPVKTVKTKRK